jgi:hypothetical protein
MMNLQSWFGCEPLFEAGDPSLGKRPLKIKTGTHNGLLRF